MNLPTQMLRAAPLGVLSAAHISTASAAAALAATLCLTVSIMTDRFGVSTLGAVPSLSLWYVLAVAGFVASGLLAGRAQLPLLLYALTGLGVTLWVVPYVLGATAPDGYHTYEDFGYVNHLLETHHLSAEAYSRYVWPGWAFIGAALVALTPLSADTVITATPAVVQGLSTLGVVALFFADDDQNAPPLVTPIALIAFVSASWGLVSSFQGHVVAYLLFVVFTCWLGRRYVQGRHLAATPADALVVVVLVSAMAVSHLLVSLVLVSGLAILAVFKAQARPVAALAFVCMLGWVVFWGSTFFAAYVAANAGYVLSFWDALMKVLVKPASAPSDFAEITRPRLFYGAALAGLGSLGVLLWLVRRRWHRLGQWALGLMVASALLVPANSVTASSYVVRLWYLMLPGLCYFAAGLIRVPYVLFGLVPLLFILPFANLWVRAGFQEYEHLTEAYVSGLTFFDEHTRGGTIAELNPRFDGDPFPYGVFAHRSRWTMIPHLEADVRGLNAVSTSGQQQWPRPLYIVATSITEAIYRGQMRRPGALPAAREWLDQSPLARVFDNGDVLVYLDEARGRPSAPPAR